MKWYRCLQKTLFGAAILAAAAAGGYVAMRTGEFPVAGQQVVQPPRTSDPGTIEDEKALRKVQADYVKAFNSGDAKTLAKFWTPDGEFVDADGKTFSGRAAIDKEFTSFFNEFKGLTLEVSTDSLRFVGPGVAVESGSSRVTRAADGTSSTTAYHIVHVKKDGQWLLASVRELPFAPASNYEHLRPLEWLVGNWTAKSGAKTLEVACEWTAKRNFLLRKYNLTLADGDSKTGMQIIGWDPVAGSIRSWMFDSDGGFGSERWIKDGPRWVIEASAVTPEGATGTATNVLTRIDQDNFTWQSIQRTLNQLALPDTALLKATRSKAKK